MTARKSTAKKAAAKRPAKPKADSNGSGEVYQVTTLGRRFVLSDVISKIKQERESIAVDGADGVVFTVPPAELWPDAVTNLIGNDNEAASKLLLGDQYDEWVRQGGTFGVLNEIIGEAAGVDVGKSATSSRSSRSTAKRSSTT